MDSESSFTCDLMDRVSPSKTFVVDWALKSKIRKIPLSVERMQNPYNISESFSFMSFTSSNTFTQVNRFQCRIQSFIKKNIKKHWWFHFGAVSI